MPRCYKNCKHYYLGFCTKYKKEILVSKNLAHYGLLLHPLDYLTLYYNYNQKDIEHLIISAEKYLTDNKSKSICRYYRQKGYITFKQRKVIMRMDTVAFLLVILAKPYSSPVKKQKRQWNVLDTT